MSSHKSHKSPPRPTKDERTKDGQGDVKASMKSPLENKEAIDRTSFLEKRIVALEEKFALMKKSQKQRSSENLVQAVDQHVDPEEYPASVSNNVDAVLSFELKKDKDSKALDRTMKGIESRVAALEEKIDLMEKFQNQESSENLVQEVKIVVDEEIFLKQLHLLEQLKNIQIEGLNIVVCMPYVVFEALQNDLKIKKVSKMARKAISFIRSNIKEPTLRGQSATLADSCKTSFGTSHNDGIIEFAFHLSTFDSSNVFIMSNNKSTINKSFFWKLNSLDVETLKQAIKGKKELSWQDFVANQRLIVHPRR